MGRDFQCLPNVARAGACFSMRYARTVGMSTTFYVDVERESEDDECRKRR